MGRAKLGIHSNFHIFWWAKCGRGRNNWFDGRWKRWHLDWLAFGCLSPGSWMSDFTALNKIWPTIIFLRISIVGKHFSYNNQKVQPLIFHFFASSILSSTASSKNFIFYSILFKNLSPFSSIMVKMNLFIQNGRDSIFLFPFCSRKSRVSAIRTTTDL